MGMQGHFEAAIAAIREARDIAEELRDLDELSRPTSNLGQTLDTSGQLEEAAQIAREGVAMCEREGIAGVEALLVERAHRPARAARALGRGRPA